METKSPPRRQTNSEWSLRGAAAIGRGDLATARDCFLAAVRADSRNAQRRFELAVVIEALGDTDGAAEHLTKALRFDPAMAQAARRLCQLLDRGMLSDTVRLDDAGLRAALGHDTVDRDLLSAAIFHHLGRHAPLRDVLRQGRNKGWLEAARELCLRRTGHVLRNEVLLEALQRGVIASIELERLFTALRRALLLEVPPERLADSALTRFALALMRQCWLNEFVWAEESDETDRLGSFKVDPGLLLAGDAAAGQALLLASLYRPPETLLDPATPADVLARVRPQSLGLTVAARFAEANDVRCRAQSIAMLGTIADETSRLVAGQYEASPYPRWTSVLTFRSGEYVRKLETIFRPHELDVLKRPFEVLIAGCGTGRQAVSAALDYGPLAHVTAVDISAVSLGYASRMAERMSAPNITFLRGDLRDIETFTPTFLGRFQVIECVGVLHHMRDPFAGWRSLRKCLAPGGLMLVGLYSALARRNLAHLKRQPEYPGSGCDESHLRAYRQRLLALPDDAPGSEFRRGADFYSSSGFRDFFLHVSEKCHNLPEIADFLAETGLVFRGFFDVPFERLRRRFPEETWPGSLERWSALEHEQPSLFGSMYQFWCTERRSG